MKFVFFQPLGSGEIIDNDILLEELMAQAAKQKKEEENKSKDIPKEDNTWQIKGSFFSSDLMLL